MHVATAAVRASLRNPERLFWLPLNVVLDRCDRSRLSEPKRDRWLVLLLPVLPALLLPFFPLCGDWEDAWQARLRPKRDDELMLLLLLHIFVFVVLSCDCVWFVFILCLEGERIIAHQAIVLHSFVGQKRHQRLCVGLLLILTIRLERRKAEVAPC